MQPYRAYGTDGVILFSDILTPLPGMGFDFDIEEKRGPVLPAVRSAPSAPCRRPLPLLLPKPRPARLARTSRDSSPRGGRRRPPRARPHTRRSSTPPRHTIIDCRGRRSRGAHRGGHPLAHEGSRPRHGMPVHRRSAHGAAQGGASSTLESRRRPRHTRESTPTRAPPPTHACAAHAAPRDADERARAPAQRGAREGSVARQRPCWSRWWEMSSSIVAAARRSASAVGWFGAAHRSATRRRCSGSSARRTHSRRTSLRAARLRSERVPTKTKRGSEGTTK